MARQDVELKFSLRDGVSAGLKDIQKGVSSVAAQLGRTVVAAGAASAAIATIGAGAAIKEGIAAAGAFEQAIVRAGQATNATTGELEAMSKAALQASSDTGTTAADAAKGLETLGRAGLSASESIAALVPVLGLAKTANIDVAEAANRTADVLDAFGIAAGKTAEVADLLASVASKSGTSFQDISAALTQSGPAARAAGVGFTDAAAALGVLAKNGIEGSRGAAGLKSILEALQDPTSKFSKALTEAGITSRDFGTVVTELGKRGDGANVAIQALGAKGTAALQAFTRDGGGAVNELVAELDQTEGAAKKAAEAIANTLPGAVNDLKNEIVNAGVGFFLPITGPLKEALQDAADAVERFAKSEDFKLLQESFQTTFTEALTTVRKFVDEIDLQDSLDGVQDFVDRAGAAFTKLGESVDKITTAFNLLESAVMVVPDSLNAAADIAAGAGAKLAAGVSIPLGLISEDAEKARLAVDKFGNEALADAGAAATDFGNDLIAAGDAIVGVDKKLEDHERVVARTARGHRNLTEETLAASRAASESKFAFDGAADSVGDAGKAAFEAAPGFSSMTQELIAVDAAIAQALAGGASAEAVEGMIARSKALKDAIDAAAAAAEKGKPSLKGMGDEGAKAFSGAAEAAREAAAAVEDATESTTRAANSAEAGTASLRDAVGGLYSYFAQTSQAAADLFAELQTGANFGSIGLESYGKAIEAADQGTQRAIDTAKAFGETSIAAFSDFAESGTIAGNAAAGAFFTTEGAIDSVQQAIDKGVGAFGLMDSQTLSRLQASLDRARSKVQALEDQARSATASLAAMGDQLQDSADQAAGNEEAIARRAYERKVKEIAELSKLAGAAGASEAARVERLAREEFDRAIARINSEKQAKIAASRDVADARIADDGRVRNAESGNTGTGLAPQLNQGQGPGPAQVRETSNLQTIAPVFNFNGLSLDKPSDKEALARIVGKELERILGRRR